MPYVENLAKRLAQLNEEIKLLSEEKAVFLKKEKSIYKKKEELECEIEAVMKDAKAELLEEDPDIFVVETTRWGDYDEPYPCAISIFRREKDAIEAANLEMNTFRLTKEEVQVYSSKLSKNLVNNNVISNEHCAPFIIKGGVVQIESIEGLIQEMIRRELGFIRFMYYDYAIETLDINNVDDD